MSKQISAFCTTPNSSLHDVILCIDTMGEGICLVVDEQYHLLGTVTDGDIRRAILNCIDLNLPVSTLLSERPKASVPITAPIDTEPAELLQLMHDHGLRHIPLIEPSNQVADIALMSELTKYDELPVKVAIMAGGFGTRLQPLTNNDPKPMLPVGTKPLLELIIEQLRAAGIKRVSVTTHYKADSIATHFGNGQDFGIDIDYLEEDNPLGTAGALSLMPPTQEPLLVINGDVLSRVDLRAMLDFHLDHQAHLTMAIKQEQPKVPFGIVELQGPLVTGISEKPTMHFFINAGIYLLSPESVTRIPKHQRYDMPELINDLIANRMPVVGFPVREYWLDIGRMEDYRQAQTDWGGSDR